MKTKLVFIIISLFALSCNQGVTIRNRSCFNLKGFFQKEIIRLKATKPGLIKSVDNNNVKEQHTFAKVDWDKELNAFLELDIENFSHKGSYRTDSLKTDSTLQITYTALDSSLSISPVILNFSTVGLIDVKAYEHKSNTLYSSYKEYNYKTNESYLIRSEQKVRFIGKNTYEISGTFSSL